MPIKISGSTGISGLDGSATTPVVQGTNVNTGIFYPTANVAAIATSGSESMRIDSSGNVGIGTSSPGAKLDVSGAINSTISGKSAQFNAAGASIYASFADGTNTWRIGNGIISSGLFSLYNSTNATQAFNIDSSGNFMMGRTTATATMHLNSAVNQNMLQLYNSVAGSGTPSILIQKASNDATTAQVLMQFLYNSGTLGLGQINGNGGSQAAFGSYSDIRVKENVENLPDQLDKICSLRPVEFDYIEGTGYSGHQTGFIAQEMQKVYPDVVAEGSDGMLTITGWNKTEARLVKAIQELTSKLDNLQKDFDDYKASHP